jgi:hypothetical protein
MKQHKHAKEIHAFAEGYTIQKKVYLCCEPRKNGHWEDCKVTPMWHDDMSYRIKPMEDNGDVEF